MLLLKDGVLVKSMQFEKHRYIGDPINAVRLFNEFFADELIILDISAGKEHRAIEPGFVRTVGEEANMPFGVGGGIRNLTQIESLIKSGAERVILGSIAAQNPGFVAKAASAFGSSTIAVCIDIKKTFFGKRKVVYQNGERSINCSPLEFGKKMQDMGAGELIIQSVNRDGMMNGFDEETIREFCEGLEIPVVALGGAGSMDDLQKTFRKLKVAGLGAGSMFVYYGSAKGVLINYPKREEFTFADR